MPEDPRVLISRSFAALGVSLPPGFDALPFPQQQVVLASWKTDVMEAAWKKLARQLHPDRNPGKDTTEPMQAVNAARDVLRQLEVRPRQVLPVVQFVVFGGSGGSGAATTSFTQTWVWRNA